MTNHEAIDLLTNIIGRIEANHGADYDRALHLAIDALKKQETPIRYVITECTELHDDYECEVDRELVCVTDDPTRYSKELGYEIYEVGPNGTLKLTKTWSE